MTHVSDVLAFAASHPDYWSELLVGEGNYPEELDEVEVEALDAAVEHIDSELEALLHTAAARFGVVDRRFTIPRFRAATTRKNRLVAIPPPPELAPEIYKIEFFADGAWDGETVQLFPAVVAKKRAMDGILTRLAERDIPHDHLDYHIYGVGQALTEGRAHDEIIAGLVESMCAVLSGCSGVAGE